MEILNEISSYFFSSLKEISKHKYFRLFSAFSLLHFAYSIEAFEDFKREKAEEIPARKRHLMN